MNSIVLEPVGFVISHVSEINQVPPGGVRGAIQLREQFLPALHRIEENSHLWVICWFDRARRDVLSTTPYHVDQHARSFGVFALRCRSRPNPIAITLVELEKVQENYLFVKGLDAVSGTPVLDIKPYFEQDSIFSPQTSYIRPTSSAMRHRLFNKMAVRHHGQESPWVSTGLHLALQAEEILGDLKDPSLFLLFPEIFS